MSSLLSLLRAFTPDPLQFLATSVLAIITLALVIATIFLVAKASYANRLADRHHQEALAPICIFEYGEMNKGMTTREGRNVPILSGPNMFLRNGGNGPATEVMLHAEVLTGGRVYGYGGQKFGPVPAGDRIPVSPWAAELEFTGGRLDFAEMLEWRITLETKDLFGNISRTVHELSNATGLLMRTAYSNPRRRK